MAEYFRPRYQSTAQQGGFDPAAAFVRGHEAAETQSLFSDDQSHLDELELIEAAREQLKHPPKAGKEEQKEIAKKMLETGEFQARIAEVIKCVTSMRMNVFWVEVCSLLLDWIG